MVATPGRLLDLIEEGVCNLEHITYMVLDEADRMLDMGFEKEVRTILSKIQTQNRQTLMFSATWPKAIQDLASQFLHEPVRVTVGSIDLSASHSVKQIVEVIDQQYKENRLDELLKEYHSSRKNRVLVFALYKKVCIFCSCFLPYFMFSFPQPFFFFYFILFPFFQEAARLEQFLIRRGWNAVSIHGDKGQNERTQALENFKNGSFPLLVATDVAARGPTFTTSFLFPLSFIGFFSFFFFSSLISDLFSFFLFFFFFRTGYP